MHLPRLTPAVKALLLVNVGVFLCGTLLYLTTGATLSPWLGLSLHSITGNPIGVLRLVTYQFVHSQFDLWHIVMNMLVLYFFGTMVEERIGTRGLVRFYLLAGITGGLFWLVTSGLMGASDIRVVGASGAVYGIMAYAALLAPMARVFFLIVILPLWVLAALLGFFALYNTMLAFRAGPGQVADAAHLGGMVFGLLWWRFHGRLAAWRAGLEAAGRARRRRREEARRKELDRILAKIKDRGMPSLSAMERRFLERYSQGPRR